MSSGMNIPLLSFGRPRRAAISTRQPVPLDKTFHVFSIRHVFVTCEHATTGDLIGRVVHAPDILSRARDLRFHRIGRISLGRAAIQIIGARVNTMCNYVSPRRDFAAIGDRFIVSSCLFSLLALFRRPALFLLTDNGHLHFRRALHAPLISTGIIGVHFYSRARPRDSYLGSPSGHRRNPPPRGQNSPQES